MEVSLPQRSHLLRLPPGPTRFLATVLPISDEVNALLIRVLDVDWRRRLTVTEMKEYVKRIDNFYYDDVVFEGSMARCTWEFGMDVESDAGESQQAEVVEVPKTNASVSRWSPDPGSAVTETPATSKQRERRSRRGGFFRDHIRLTFPRQNDSSRREAALAFSPPSPSTKPPALSTNNMVEAVSYGDTSGPITTNNVEQKSDTDRPPEADHVVSQLKNKIRLKELSDLERDQAQSYADILDAVQYSIKSVLQSI